MKTSPEQRAALAKIKAHRRMGQNAATVEILDETFRALLADLDEALRLIAGGSEPIYQLHTSEGKWIDQKLHSYEYNLEHGHEVRIVYLAQQSAIVEATAELTKQLAEAHAVIQFATTTLEEWGAFVPAHFKLLDMVKGTGTTIGHERRQVLRVPTLAQSESAP